MPRDDGPSRPGASLPIEVAIEYRGRNKFFADYVQNISRGRTFIPTRNPLQPGTRFLFRLSVPGAAEQLRVGGVVVEAVTAGPASGMGVRFLWADEEELGAFRRAVERLMAESLGALSTEKLLEKAGSVVPSRPAAGPEPGS